MYHSALGSSACAASQTGKRLSSASNNAGVKPQRFIDTRSVPVSATGRAGSSRFSAPPGTRTSRVISVTETSRPSCPTPHTPRATLPCSESVWSSRYPTIEKRGFAVPPAAASPRNAASRRKASRP